VTLHLSASVVVVVVVVVEISCAMCALINVECMQAMMCRETHCAYVHVLERSVSHNNCSVAKHVS
jgi:hypothetical protein